MKISKALLGAIVVGITVQTTVGCSKKDTPELKKQAAKDGKGIPQAPDNCPACGMG
jgi:hypothetical protein